jgi:tripartite-type tricarboxylate transporter receptor subunit TctC
MRALAVTSAKRSPAVPAVPTLMESGIPIDVNLWFGLFAPAATPRPILAKLNEDITRFLDTPHMKEWLLNALGAEFAPHTPEQFKAFVDADAARWQKIANQIGVKLD